MKMVINFTLEDFEEELRHKMIMKYNDETRLQADKWFLIQLRGNYKNKELKFTDLLDVGSAVVIATGTNWQDCYDKILKEL